MQSTRSYTNRENEFNFFTRMLADFCHNCGMCRYTARGPCSAFGRRMGWRRNWCPGWAARSRVYGDEPIESDTPYPPSECDCYDDAERHRYDDWN
jgi:hypothetical protein